MAKGLSMDQKKAKALEWLKRQNTFFHMKVSDVITK